MKVLFSFNLPFFSGAWRMQTYIEALKDGLISLGIEVEPERWWDENQKGDILHYMHRPPAYNVGAAQQKGFKVVMTELLDHTSSRTRMQLMAQRALTNWRAGCCPPLSLIASAGRFTKTRCHGLYRAARMETAKYLFGANPDRGHVVPYGLEPQAMAALSLPQPEEDYLVCMARFHPRKNPVLLAQAARLAKTPIVFLGKPYSEDDPIILNSGNSSMAGLCATRGMFRGRRNFAGCGGRVVLPC